MLHSNFFYVRRDLLAAAPSSQKPQTKAVSVSQSLRGEFGCIREHQFTLNIDVCKVECMADLMQKHTAKSVAWAKSWTHSGVIRDNNDAAENGLAVDVNPAMSEYAIAEAKSSTSTEVFRLDIRDPKSAVVRTTFFKIDKCAGEPKSDS
jgi:hypothetical protein